jgi:phytanoyl-CoA hydroxylase
MKLTSTLTPLQKQNYERDGFLVLPKFASNQQCNELMKEADQLIEGFTPEDHPTIFSTTDQIRHSNEYFLGSGDRIRFFFEADAFHSNGKLKQAKHLSINKIGHALHDLNPVFDRFSRQEKLASICSDLGVEKPLLMQSMYIFKQPRIGGEVVCHQDATYLFTEPMSVVGFWFALQDATLENGCLFALPGGHRSPLKRKFSRDCNGGVNVQVLDSSPWPESGYVPLEVKKGTLVLLHGLLPHLSGPNHSDQSRHAYTLHVIDGAAQYPSDNWLQRSPEMPARGFH